MTVSNDGKGNPNPEKDDAPGYLVGMDPYLATGTYEKIGVSADVALSDLPPEAGTGDHDYQDMVVRITVVPEPASLALLGIALGGLGFSRRRRADA